MNKDNILAVADAIEKHSVPTLGFNMSNWVATVPSGRGDGWALDHSGHSCGTVACIAGWTKTVREGRVPKPSSGSAFSWGDEGQWLGLDEETAERLFFGENAFDVRLDEITTEDAVSVLRRLAATGSVDWLFNG